MRAPFAFFAGLQVVIEIALDRTAFSYSSACKLSTYVNSFDSRGLILQYTLILPVQHTSYKNRKLRPSQLPRVLEVRVEVHAPFRF